MEVGEALLCGFLIRGSQLLTAEGTDTLVVAVFIFPRCARAHALAAITQLPPSLRLLGELRGFQAPEVNGKQMEPFFSLALLKGAEHCRASCFWQN